MIPKVVDVGSSTPSIMVCSKKVALRLYFLLLKQHYDVDDGVDDRCSCNNLFKSSHRHHLLAEEADHHLPWVKLIIAQKK